MLRPLPRLVPAVAAALAATLIAVGSLAFAGDRDRSHPRSWGDGHHSKRCDRHRVSAWDEQWLKMSLQTDLFEILGGEAAQQRATTDVVRALATRLVQDHSASFAEGAALAERLGIEAPREPAPLQRWALRAVAEFSGADFDRWFADLQVEGHRQAIMLAEAEVERGCNRKVRRFAAAILPVLQDHLRHAEEALAALQR